MYAVKLARVSYLPCVLAAKRIVQKTLTICITLSQQAVPCVSSPHHLHVISYVLPAALVKAMRHDGQGKLFTARASTEGQLATALQQAFSPDKADHLAFIEV
jgi:hypothetical protein